MEEEAEVNSSSPEVAPPEAESHEAKVEAQPKEVSNDRNWRAIRQRNAELEQKLKMQEEMMAAVLTASQQASRQQVVDEIPEPEDEIATYGKVKKYAKKEVEPLQRQIKDLEEKLEKQKQFQFIDNLRRQFSDFDEIVNPETLSLLEEKDPELAQIIADQKDPYKIALSSYKYIKSLNLVEKVPESRHAREVEKKMEKNAKTVQTPQAYEKRPLAQAFNYADITKNKTLQDELYREMTTFAQQSGFGY